MMGKSTDIQTMSLLWRPPDSAVASKSPGPKRQLEVDDVVQAGIDVADASGSVGISMRAVAEQLSVTPMTLYGYVPSKEALVALMYDAVHAEMPHMSREGSGWRRSLVVWLEDLVDLYVRHPWALGVSYARPVLGPHEQHILESLILFLRDTELEPGLLRRVVGMLFHVVRGTARTIAEAHEAAETSGISEQEWWQGSSGALSSVVPDFADRFPNTMWLFSGPNEDPGDEARGYVDRQARGNFRVGLNLLLDGLEAG